LTSRVPSIEELYEPRGGLAIAQLEQLGKFIPVDLGSIKPQGDPSAITMVWRREKATVLRKGVAFCRVREEVDRPT
jgi:hypothetical protein